MSSPPTLDLQIINVILQGGSFAFLVLAGVWIARTLVPRLFKTFDDLQSRHDARYDRQEARHDADKTRRDLAFDKISQSVSDVANGLSRVVTALNDVVDRLESLEARTPDSRHD